MCYPAQMVKQLRLRQAGGSVSATLPKEMVDRMRLRAGDDVFAVETPDGILITPYDESTALALEAGREGARRYRNALRRLAH
jgi:putative addiction module antidote